MKKDMEQSRNFSGSKKGTNLLLLFLINPLIAFFSALYYRNNKYALWVVAFFSCFIGFVFVPPEGHDAFSYKQNFLSYDLNLNELINSTIYNLLFFGIVDDFLLDILYYLIGIFTDNHFFLWASLGLIFGIFYAKNAWILFNAIPRKFININALIFIIAFLIVINPYNGINQRIWISVVIFFWGVINYLFYYNKKYVIFASLSIFVHVAMIAPLIGFLLFAILGRRELIYIGIFTISLFTAFFDFSFLLQNVDLLGPVIEDKFFGYTSERAHERFQTGAFVSGSWFMVWRADLLLWSLSVGLFYAYFRHRKFFTEFISGVFCISLIMISIINFLGDFPMIYRYWPIGILFGLAFMFLYNQYFNFKKLQLLTLFMAPSILLYCIVQLRMSLESISAFIFFTNPIIEIFIEHNNSVWDLIPY